MANELPTADSLFDGIEPELPSADSLFGDAYTPKPVGPSATWGKGVGRSGAGGTKNFLAETSLGRVMDATGMGAKEGWGQAPIGLSEENKLRMMTGDYDAKSKGWMDKPFTVGGTYTELVAQPLAAAMDVMFRGPQAAVGAAASAANQLAAEYSPKWLNKFLGLGTGKNLNLSTDVKDNVVSEEQAIALNNQLGAVLALATFPDPVYNGLKPVPPEAMLNRQQAFKQALGDPDLPPVAKTPEGKLDLSTDLSTLPARAAEAQEFLDKTSKPNVAEAPLVPTVEAYPYYKLENGDRVPYTRGPEIEVKPADLQAGQIYTSSDGYFTEIKETTVGEVSVETGRNSKDSAHITTAGKQPPVSREEMAKRLNDGKASLLTPKEPDASTSPVEGPTVAPEEPATLPAQEAPTLPTDALERSKDISVADLGEPGSLEGQMLSLNPDLAMYNQYGNKTSMVDINNLSEVTGVPVDALIRRDSPYSNLDPVQSIKLEKAFQQMSQETKELGAKVTDEASAMSYLKARQRQIQSLVDVEQKDYLKGLALRAEQAVSKEDKLKSRAVATFFRDQDFEGAFTPEGKLTPEGLKAIQDEAAQIGKIETAAGINHYLRKKTKDQASGFYAKARDMTLEYLYNWGMLSSLKTHAANIISNTLVAILRVGETQLAGGMGTVRGLFTKADDRVYMGEAYQKAFGLVQGIPEGLKAASKAFKDEEPTFGRSTKVEINKKAVPGLLGKGVRLPGNLMMAEDEFFKAMAYRASINSQAYREGVKKGLTGQDFANHIAKRAIDPSDKMREIAYKEANYDTFTKDLGSTGKKIEALGREWPIAKFLTFPFMRTPTNVFKFFGERTPMSLASKEVRSILKGDKGKAARDEQVAKMLIGTGIMYAGFQWASQGKMTGNGPKDPIERAQWLGEGNLPNSLIVDGEQYRLDRLGPIGTLLSIAADTNAIWDKRGRAATQKLAAGDLPSADELADMNTLLLVMAGNVATQLPLVNGISDLSDALNEDDGYKLNKLFNNVAQRFIPAVGADLARMNDPYIRDIKTLQDALNSRIPWKAQEVPAMLDTFGHPVENTMQGAENFANPIQHKPANTDPIYKAMQDVGYQMARPNKTIGNVELTREQYHEYWSLSGTASKIALADMINSIGEDNWATIPPGVRKEMMVNTVKRIRETTAGLMKMKYYGGDASTDIIKQMYENKMNIFSPIGDD